MTKLTKDNEKKINFISKQHSNCDINPVQVPKVLVHVTESDICAKCSFQAFG